MRSLSYLAAKAACSDSSAKTSTFSRFLPPATRPPVRDKATSQASQCKQDGCKRIAHRFFAASARLRRARRSLAQGAGSREGFGGLPMVAAGATGAPVCTLCFRERHFLCCWEACLLSGRITNFARPAYRLGEYFVSSYFAAHFRPAQIFESGLRMFQKEAEISRLTNFRTAPGRRCTAGIGNWLSYPWLYQIQVPVLYRRPSFQKTRFRTALGPKTNQPKTGAPAKEHRPLGLIVSFCAAGKKTSC